MTDPLAATVPHVAEALMLPESTVRAMAREPYENGIPVRMRWVECHCPVHQAEIDAANAAIERR